MDLILFAVIIFFLLGAYAINTYAQYLNIRFLSPDLPEEFQDTYDAQKYRQSQQYTREQARVDILESSVGLFLLILFIFLNGFNYVDNAIRAWGLSSIWTGLAFFGLLGLASSVVSLPFELYQTFILEERFNFNKMTWVTFIKDKLKGLLLALLLGVPILGAILWFFQKFPAWGWAYAWVFLTLASLVLSFLAPRIILPLFNKFTPLPEGDLKDKILNYAKRVGFNISGIYVMDGSKRSTKSNAFFTGFGKTKRIALFDTLLEKHTDNELLAILAHEVGHYKLKHILKNMGISIVKMGIILWLISFFIQYKPLFAAFNMDHVSVHAGLVFFAFLYTPVSLVLALVFNYLSRKYEYEADEFASKTTNAPQDLISALKRLSLDNLSNLTPHPFYVVLNYSHPPVLKRIKAIKELDQQAVQTV